MRVLKKSNSVNVCLKDAEDCRLVRNYVPRKIIQTKNIEHGFTVLLFIMIYEVVFDF